MRKQSAQRYGESIEDERGTSSGTLPIWLQRPVLRGSITLSQREWDNRQSIRPALFGRNSRKLQDVILLLEQMGREADGDDPVGAAGRGLQIRAVPHSLIRCGVFQADAIGGEVIGFQRQEQNYKFGPARHGNCWDPAGASCWRQQEGRNSLELIEIQRRRVQTVQFLGQFSIGSTLVVELPLKFLFVLVE